MPNHIFISYPAGDQKTAEAIQCLLEQSDLSGRLAPRDEGLEKRPVTDFSKSPLEEARLLLLVFSSRANESGSVLREVRRASERRIPIVPVRIDNTVPHPALGDILGERNWIDATQEFTPARRRQLAGTVKILLASQNLANTAAESAGAPASAPSPATAAPLPPPAVAAVDPPAAPPAEETAKTSPSEPALAPDGTDSRTRDDQTVPPPTKRPYALIAIVVSVLLALVVLGFVFSTFRNQQVASSTPRPVPTPVLEGDQAALVPPLDLQIRATGPDTVELTWSAQAPPPDQYLIERSTEPAANYQPIEPVPGSATTKIDNGLAPGKTYYYRVTAMTGSKKSHPTESVSQEIVPSAAAAPSSTATVSPAETSAATVTSTPETTATPEGTPAPAIATESSPKAPPVESYLFHCQSFQSGNENILAFWAEEYLKKMKGTDVEKISVDSSHLVVKASLPGKSQAQGIEIISGSTDEGLRALSGNSVDLLFAGRRVRPGESRSGTDDLRARASENVAALAAVAVIVNKENPLVSLKIDQLEQIFSRKAKDWTEFGGSSGPITAFVCDQEPDTVAFFQSAISRDSAAMNGSPGGQSDEVSDRVAKTPGAIGIVRLSAVRENKVLKVGDGNAEALAPTPYNVHTEDYALTQRLYLYQRADRKNDAIKGFLQYVLSPEGQAIPDEHGLIGLNPLTESFREIGRSGVPAAARQVMEGTVALGISMRFLPGAATLDNRAQQDLKRIRELRNRPEFKRSTVLLFGFGDNPGNTKASLDLSKARAHTVESALEAEKVPVTATTGLGAVVPDAPGDQPRGRERNLRVEVWMRK